MSRANARKLPQREKFALHQRCFAKSPSLRAQFKNLEPPNHIPLISDNLRLPHQRNRHQAQRHNAQTQHQPEARFRSGHRKKPPKVAHRYGPPSTFAQQSEREAPYPSQSIRQLRRRPRPDESHANKRFVPPHTQLERSRNPELCKPPTCNTFSLPKFAGRQRPRWEPLGAPHVAVTCGDFVNETR